MEWPSSRHRHASAARLVVPRRLPGGSQSRPSNRDLYGNRERRPRRFTFRQKGIALSNTANTSSTEPTRARRRVIRVAAAGALAAVSLTAVAVPAFATTTAADASATSIAWQPDGQRPPGDQDHRGDNDHRGPDGDNRSPDSPRPSPLPGVQLPTGSAG